MGAQWWSAALSCPLFALFIIALGVLCYAVLEWILQHTAAGKLMKSLASDPWMAGMLGINVPRFYAWIVVIGFFLAGLAGGLLLPNQTLSPSLASVFVVQAFGVLIVGGMGNIRGAFLASILLCVVELRTVRSCFRKCRESSSMSPWPSCCWHVHRV